MKKEVNYGPQETQGKITKSNHEISNQGTHKDCDILSIGIRTKKRSKIIFFSCRDKFSELVEKNLEAFISFLGHKKKFTFQ